MTPKELNVRKAADLNSAAIRNKDSPKGIFRELNFFY